MTLPTQQQVLDAFDAFDGSTAAGKGLQKELEKRHGCHVDEAIDAIEAAENSGAIKRTSVGGYRKVP